MSDDVRIGGGDTATPCNLARRVALLDSAVGLRDQRLLDAGCGAGEYVEAFAQRGADAFGVEFNTGKVRQYLVRHPGSRRVIQGDLVAVPFANDSFDIIVLNEVLEHTPDQMGALREMRRLLRKGGCLAVFCPNRLYPFETHGVLLRRSGRALSPWVPLVPYIPLPLGRRWFTYPARNYWPRELAHVIAAGGFQIRVHRWLWQTFENISGRQPPWVARASPGLRKLSRLLEECPVICRLGVTQVVLAVAP